MKTTAKSKTGRPSPNPNGRPKGTPNKLTTEVRSMILSALDKAGGQAYLVRQATENPVAFMTLLGKLIPSEVRAELSGPDGQPLLPVAPIFNVTVTGK